MLDIGNFNNLKVEKIVDFGVYLSDGIDEKTKVLLPKKFAPKDIKLGDDIDVFLYLDSEDRLIATTQTPYAKVGDFALLKVKEQSKIGAFLDWGLEKDLFVPFREQPTRMIAGKYYIVKLYLDKVTNRIVASSRLSKFCTGKVENLQENQKVDVIICEKLRLGYRVIVDEFYIGIIYFNECHRKVEIGDKLEGFVHTIRVEENRVDIRLRQDGIDGVFALKDTILESLKNNNNVLPINSNSSPEDIQKYFTMSKRSFKQAIGMLYKERKILIEENSIKLI